MGLCMGAAARLTAPVSAVFGPAGQSVEGKAAVVAQLQKAEAGRRATEFTLRPRAAGSRQPRAVVSH